MADEVLHRQRAPRDGGRLNDGRIHQPPLASLPFSGFQLYVLISACARTRRAPMSRPQIHEFWGRSHSDRIDNFPGSKRSRVEPWLPVVRRTLYFSVRLVCTVPSGFADLQKHSFAMALAFFFSSNSLESDARFSGTVTPCHGQNQTADY